MHNMSSKIVLLIFSLVIAISTSAGEKKPPPVYQWPLPPNQAKVQFVRFWNGEQDFGKRSSFKDLLLGKEQKRDTTKLEKPYGIAVDSRGTLYVCDTILGRVFVFDAGKKKLRYLGLEGPGALRKPIGITISSNDDIWVADAERKIVLRYHPDGSVVGTFGKVNEMQNPTSLAVDEAKGRLYVCDSHAHQIKIYDIKTNELVKTIGERGTEDGQFNYPTNVAVDKDGYLFVVDSLNFRVQIFDSDGTFDSKFGEAGDQPGTLARPRGIAIDPQGNIFIADAIHNSVQIYNGEFDLLMWLGGFQGIGPGEFIQPSGLFITQDGTLYVGDSLNHRVQVFKLLYVGKTTQKGG